MNTSDAQNTGAAKSPHRKAVHGTCEISIHSYALLNEGDDIGAISKLTFSEHSFVFAGNPSRTDIIWGPWGLASQNIGNLIYSKFAAENKLIPITLILQYTLQGEPKLNGMITSDLIEESGFVNISRLTIDLKNQLKEKWLEIIRQSHGSAALANIASEPIENIAARYPNLVQAMLDGPYDLGKARDLHINVVIHPVLQALVETKPPYPAVQIASLRRSEAVNARLSAQYLPNTQVIL